LVSRPLGGARPLPRGADVGAERPDLRQPNWETVRGTMHLRTPRGLE
jgi:hypothetical protein